MVFGEISPGIPIVCGDSGGIVFDHVLTVLIWGLVKTYGAFGEEHASYVDEKSTRFFFVISKHTWDDVGLNSYDS